MKKARSELGFMVALIAIMVFAAGGAWAGDYYVRTDGNDGNDGSANDAAHAWLTIQHAVDNVSSGDTIHVAAGTYNEATTFLDHAGLNFDATRGGIMLRGANAGIPGYGTRGTESIIEGPNVLHGNAIYIFDGADGVVIDGFTLKAGDDIVENRADDVVIKNNIITPISGTPADPNAPGIFACECDNLTAAYNWVRDTGNIGMFLGLASYSADITNSQIEHNLIENSGGAGILFNYASGTGGNTVEYNEIKNVGHDGIRGGPSASGMTIKHNEIYGSARDGVRIMGDATSHLINYNSIYSSVGYGVNNLHTETLDAECNWWGDASGPTHAGNPGGTGDAVSDNVDYDPWLRASINYGDVTLSGGSQEGHFPQVWDLTCDCDLVISFTYDANGLVDDFGGGAHAWAELGVREVGYGDFNPTWMAGGAGVWLSTDYEWSANTFDPDPLGAPSQDLDDKLILQRGGGMDESYYNLPSPPPNPWANHRIWWDRDGVDPWQNDETANTGGIYNIEIRLHATSPTSGEAYMSINGLDQGFETDGNWNTVELTPAGMTFTGNMSRMQVFYGLYGYGATHSIVFKDITVKGGCLAKNFLGYKVKTTKVCDGGVTELTLLNNGPEGDITVTAKSGVVFGPEGVPNNEHFSFGTLGVKLGTSITITKKVGDVSSETTIHTSCSQPIYPDLAFGDFVVVEGESLKGGTLATPAPDFVPLEVTLTDQFETAIFKVEKPDKLYNPANKNDEGINDEETHLMGYKIKLLEYVADPTCAPCKGGLISLTLQYNGTDPALVEVTTGKENEVVLLEPTIVANDEQFTVLGTGKEGKLGKEINIWVGGTLAHTIHTSCSQAIGTGQAFDDFTVVDGESKDGGPICPIIRVEDQFGTLLVARDKAERLLVPTAKSLTGLVDPLDQTGVDHFKCYKVKTIKGAFPEDLQAHVVDQFNQPKLYDVEKPTRLCTPVEKKVDGVVTEIKNPDKHLMCYKVRPAEGQPEHEEVTGIHVNNQFGPLILDTDKEEELCVPCTKNIAAQKAPLYDSSPFTCEGGAKDTSGPTFGFVILNTNVSGDLIVEVELKGATAQAAYDIWVNQDPGACPLSSPTAPAALTTDVNGNGNAHVEVARVASATNFWISAVGGGQVLRSTAVVLD